MPTETTPCSACVSTECLEHAVPCDVCEEPIWPGPQLQHAVHIELDTHPDGERLLVHAGCSNTPLLRCLYSTWDAHGGPEEGGWTFKCGSIEAAVPVALEYLSHTHARVTASADALLDGAFAGLPQRRVWSFGVPAVSFPEKKPHYE